mgnify:FL=1
MDSQEKIDHFYFTIQGWFNYHDVYDMALSWFGDESHFVEIGSWKGRSSAYMATNIHNSGKKIRFDCVDTWKGSWEHHLSDEDVDKHFPDEGSRWQMKNLKKKDLFGQFTRNIKPVRHVITPVKMTSVKAAKRYDDKSLDFVFMDGAHDEKNVYQDISAWMPKLKDTGVIAGDDFLQQGVRLGLKKYAAEHGDFEMSFGANIMTCWIRVNEKTKQHWRTPLT